MSDLRPTRSAWSLWLANVLLCWLRWGWACYVALAVEAHWKQ